MSKGMTVMLEFIITTLLLIATLCIVLVLLIKFGIITQSDSDAQLCRTTLAVQGKIDNPIINPTTSKCIRRIVEVSEKNVQSKSKLMNYVVPLFINNKTVVSYHELNDTIMNSFLSDSLRRCWYMGLEGKEAVFNRGYSNGKTICMICDEIHVKMNDDKQLNQDKQFATYLNMTLMPNLKERMTYGKYLFTPTSVQIAMLGLRRLVVPLFNVALRHSYNPEDAAAIAGTFCLNLKKVDMDPVFKTGSYATIFFRYHSNTDGGCMNAYVIPATKVKTLCDYVAN